MKMSYSGEEPKIRWNTIPMMVGADGGYLVSGASPMQAPPWLRLRASIGNRETKQQLWSGQIVAF